MVCVVEFLAFICTPTSVLFYLFFFTSVLELRVFGVYKAL